MKKAVLNIGAIVIAFIIGLAINNACAGDLDNMSDTELRNLVSKLQQEVNNLKSKVAELESKIGNTSSSSSGSDGASFVVDGACYSKDGNRIDPIDYYESNNHYSITNGVKTTDGSSAFKVKYSYDSNGRVSKSVTERSSSVLEINYSHSGKTSTYTSKTTYKNPSSMGGVSETGYTTTYHFK